MWYVIWTRAGQEEQCKSVINKKCDPATYRRLIVPKNEIKKKYGREWISEVHILFPSYVFVETESIEEFAGELEKIKGFRKLLKSEDLFLSVSQEEAERIFDLLDDEEIISASVGIKEENGKVKVLKGPLVGRESLIKRIDRHKRFAILEFEINGRKTLVRMSLEVVDYQEND